MKENEMYIHPGKMIADLAKEHGESINALAVAIGEHRQVLNSIVMQQRAISVRLAIKIERYYNIPIGTLSIQQARYNVFQALKKESTELRQKQKNFLIARLFEVGRFWSYEKSQVEHTISDEQIISETLQALDIAEVNMLFEIYPQHLIKKIWLTQLVPQGDYLYATNRVYAWLYFGIKMPDRYLHTMMTKHINSISQ